MPRMKICLYNTLTKREEPFEPLDPPRVRIYHCGPTVYSYPHIGNMSAFLFADILRRTLEYAGFDVTQVMNITDVGHMTLDDIADAAGEDKLEAAARRERRTPWDLARHYVQAFLADLEALNIRAAHYYPRATEFVPEMIRLIERLLERGYAYRAGGDVYFDLAKFPSYGRLSGNTLEKLEAGARVEVRGQKRNPHDFALWKSDPKHIMQWDSPFGRGFPGWHIECSAMSMRFLGESFDIHTGAEDNIFPHHECEIAQSEAATGKPFVRYWVHARFLLVDGKKMAKSLGNVFTVRDILERGYGSRELRYALASTHYRTQPNFTFEGLESARRALERIDNFVLRLEETAGTVLEAAEQAPTGAEARAEPDWIGAARAGFEQGLAADLNLSAALAAIFELVREGNRRPLSREEAAAALGFLREAENVLGFIFWKGVPPRAADRAGAKAAQSGAATLAPEAAVAPTQAAAAPWAAEGAVACDVAGPGALPQAEAERLLAQREEARKRKDWARADEIRERLASSGYAVEDTLRGPRLRRRT